MLGMGDSTRLSPQLVILLAVPQLADALQGDARSSNCRPVSSSAVHVPVGRGLASSLTLVTGVGIGRVVVDLFRTTTIGVFVPRWLCHLAVAFGIALRTGE